LVDVETIFRNLQAAYASKDIAVMMSFVTDDYSVYNVTESGPKRLVASREEATRALQAVFGNTDYISGSAESIQAVGNIVYATEVDIFNHNGTEKRMTRFGVYEFVGDKLFRAWSFPVQEAGQPPGA